jgi:hypothetical protein
MKTNRKLFQSFGIHDPYSLVIGDESYCAITMQDVQLKEDEQSILVKLYWHRLGTIGRALETTEFSISTFMIEWRWP